MADLSRPIVLKARRDTLVLLFAVTAATFALSSAIHSRPLPAGTPPQQHWTGQLSDVVPTEPPSSDTAPLTSASLVLPPSALTLPPLPVRELVKLRGCDGAICGVKTSVPVPVRRPSGVAVASNRRSVPHQAKPSLMSNLNPLNHLPDIAQISRPFAVAGDTVSNWFSRF